MRLFVKPILAGVLALSAISPAMAEPQRYSQSRHDDRGRDRDRHDRRDHDRNWRDDRGRHNDRDWRDGRRDDRGWRETRHWRKGDRFDHRTRYVVVRDYDRYHLRAPRRGEYYARTDTGDILLIAAATGLVIWALNQ